VVGVCGLACSVPRAYQSPRTTPPGQISHSLAFDVGQGFFEEDRREEEILIAPEGQNPAVYTMRVGLAERWEVAGSLGTLLLATELKWNFLRSPSWDAALAPRAQYYEPLAFSGDTRTLLTLSLPVPIAFNVSREVSFIASPALAYAAGQTPGERDEEFGPRSPARGDHGLVAAAALDVQLRATSRLAFQPGVTVYRRLPQRELRWQLGVAFGWGRMPFYGDVPP
jgi:hypothetical protein